MRVQRHSLHHWLSLRVRLACLAVLLASLALPTHVPESGVVLPDFGQEHTPFLIAEDGFLIKSSSLTEQGTRGAFTRGIIHTVEPGETIGSIAKSADVSTDTIRWANALRPNDGVKTGDTLLILPVNGITHTVKRGQNLSAIAELYSVPVDAIASQNKIQGGYLLAGQELIIPGGKPIVRSPPAIIAKANPAAKPETAKAATLAQATFTSEETFGILQKPCTCFITQYFTAGHYGLDMQQRGGGPIYAAEAGTVIRADYGWNGGYGNVVEIDHGNGLVTLYGHNKALHVNVGDSVDRGQYIADMGNTGLVHGPTGIHVHFEVQFKGEKKNPLMYLQE